MKKYFILFLFAYPAFSQEFKEITIDKEITNVQPMTGIVFWPGNSHKNTDAISLEYSYMNYNDVVKEEGTYDWTAVEELLDDIASRNHQALLRFRFTYPGRTTTVPDYIKALPDYNETEGISEGNQTWFPDWTNPELQRFTIEFYAKYAERYDNDPRLAFVQTGFGLWAEYHIYDGPFVLGETFPSKAFQESFFLHLDTVFKETYWSISIDAASDTYSPFREKPELKEINFGLFDDSFMHKTHGSYNTSSWNFFDRERYKIAPAGGEFSYYTNFDQRNVLKADSGAHGKPYELFAEDFHITYMIGNDQPRYQTIERIREASLYSGYKFKVVSFKSKPGESIVEMKNVGLAPFYYDAFVTVDGVRATESLKLLAPGESKTFTIAAGGENPELVIESDRILPGQSIDYYGTVNDFPKYEQPAALGLKKNTGKIQVYPTVLKNTTAVTVKTSSSEPLNLTLHGLNGRIHLSESVQGARNYQLVLPTLAPGLYILSTGPDTYKLIVE